MARRALHQADVTYWTDDDGLVHICESTVPLSNELLVWTLCDREVESGAGYVPSRYDDVTCSKCAAAEDVLRQRAGARLQPALP